VRIDNVFDEQIHMTMIRQKNYLNIYLTDIKFW